MLLIVHCRSQTNKCDRSAIFLHSVGIQMFTDLGWDASLAIEQWKAAAISFSELLNRSSVESLNPAIAFCAWVACQATICHLNFHDPQISVAVFSFIQALQGMGKIWSVAAFYADHSSNALNTVRTLPAVPSTSMQSSPCPSQGSPSATSVDTSPTSYSTPATVLSEDDAMMLSCIDWPKFEMDGVAEAESVAS